MIPKGANKLDYVRAALRIIPRDPLNPRSKTLFGNSEIFVVRACLEELEGILEQQARDEANRGKIRNLGEAYRANR